MNTAKTFHYYDKIFINVIEFCYFACSKNIIHDIKFYRCSKPSNLSLVKQFTNFILTIMLVSYPYGIGEVNYYAYACIFVIGYS